MTNIYSYLIKTKRNKKKNKYQITIILPIFSKKFTNYLKLIKLKKKKEKKNHDFPL